MTSRLLPRFLLVLCLILVGTDVNAQVVLSPAGRAFFCPGGSVTLNATGAAAGATYKWVQNGALVAGATTATLSATLNATYRVVATVGGVDDSSAPVVVRQVPPVIHVDGSVTASGGGATWATAFKTLGEALTMVNNSTCATEIWVKAGTYYPTTASGGVTTSRDSSFRILRNGVKLFGGFNGTETVRTARNIAANPTILSGDIGTINDSLDNTVHVMTVVGGVNGVIDTTTRIDGFTITRGNGDVAYQANIYGVYAEASDGGGLLLVGSGTGNDCSPTIANCIIERNYANVGGGVYCGAYYGGGSSPYFRDCIVRNNRANDAAGIHSFTGNLNGGTVAPRILKTQFINNSAYGNAGALGCYNAGGVASNGPYVESCVFTGNTAGGSGGVFSTYTGDCNLKAFNSIFAGNSSAGAGGALSLGGGGTALLTNCTFSNNTSSGVPGAGTIDNAGALNLHNSIVWGAVATQIMNSGSISYSYSNVRAITPPLNSLSLDPLFVNASDPDGVDNTWGTSDDGLRLQNCSPLIDRGLNTNVPAALTTDFAVATRVQQNAVDMGAYESSSINSYAELSTLTTYGPTTCSGTEGGIGLGRLVPGRTYTINYSRNSVPQNSVTTTADASGQVLISGLNAGFYDAFSATFNGCTTPAFPGATTLMDPAPPVLNGVTTQNPVTCGATNGTITLAGTFPGVSADVSYSLNGTPVGAVSFPVSSGSIVVTGLGAGIYTNISVRTKGCASNTLAGPYTLTNPNPVIGNVTGSNPATCGGSDGSILISGLGQSVTYSLRYSLNGTAQPAVALPSSTSGDIVLSGLSAGTYSNFSVSISVCTSPVVAGPIVLNPPPSPVISSVSTTDPTICGGTNGSILISGLAPSSTAYTVTYVSGTTTTTAPPASTNAAGTFTIPGLAAGTYTNITVSRSNCQTSYATPVTLNAPPTPATPVPSSNSPVCSGTSINLSTASVPGGSYSWTGPNSFSSAIQNPSISAATAAMAGTYQLVVTVANCASAPGSTTIVINQSPQGVTATVNNPVCANTTINLSGASTTTGVTYAWSGPNGFSSASQNPSIPTATSAMNGVYTLTVTNPAATCSATATATVTVRPIPTFSGVTGTNPVTCNGTSGTLILSGLTASTAYSVTYLKGTTNTTGSGTSDATGVLTLTGIGRGSFSNFVVTQSGCASAPFAGPVVLTDPPIPVAPIASSNSPVCQGATVNLSVTGLAGATFSWTGPSSFTSSSATPTVTNLTSTKAGTYNVTQSIANCVSPAAPVVVVMTPLPSQPASISGPTAPCLGTTNTYTTTSTNATSFTWTLPAADWTGTSTTGSISAVTGATSGTIRVVGVNACGTGTARTLSVNVNTLPAAAGTITGSAAICNGSVTTYSIPTVSNTTGYTWVLPAGWAGTSTTNSISATPGAGSGTIYVLPVNACGSGNSASLNVTVTSIPAQPGTITGNLTPCIGSSETYFIAPVSGATSYAWQYPSGGTPAWSGATTGSSVIAAVGSASGNMSVTASNQCGTSSPRSLAITVTQLPAAAGAISGNSAPCIGATTTYSIPSVANATSYNWSYPTGWTANSTTNTTTVGVGTGAGNITVTPVGVCGNGAPASIAVTATPVVTPSVVLARSTPGDTICAGTSVTFTATGTNAGSNPTYVFRRNGSFIVSSASNTYSTNALVSGDRISVTMISSLPCVSQSQVSDSLRTIVLPVLRPGININTQPPTVLCAGQTVTLQTNDTNGGPAPTYQWYQNGTRIAGVITRNYTPPSIGNRDTFFVEMTTSVACPLFSVAVSNRVGFNVVQVVTPTVSITADPAGPVMTGTSVTFTATPSNGGGSPSYQWLRNGVEVSGATASTWTSSSLANGDEVSVRMLSVALCADTPLVRSNAIRMTVGTTGIAQTGGSFKGDIRLYPNPNTGRFTVEASNLISTPGQRSSIDVLNALGQTVYHMTFLPDRNTWSHDVYLNDGVANGTYLLRVQSENGGATAIPFVLNR